MKERVTNSAELKQVFKDKLADFKDAAAADQVNAIVDTIDVEPVYLTDKLIYRAIVVSLCLVIGLVIIGSIVFSIYFPAKKLQDGTVTITELPTAIITFASTALGALTGLLIPASRQKS